MFLGKSRELPALGLSLSHSGPTDPAGKQPCTANSHARGLDSGLPRDMRLRTHSAYRQCPRWAPGGSQTSPHSLQESDTATVFTLGRYRLLNLLLQCLLVCFCLGRKSHAHCRKFRDLSRRELKPQQPCHPDKSAIDPQGTHFPLREGKGG